MTEETHEEGSPAYFYGNGCEDERKRALQEVDQLPRIIIQTNEGPELFVRYSSVLAILSGAQWTP